MRALFSIVSLLIVLGVILITVKHQLRASQQLLPSADAPASAGSAPFGGARQPGVAQYQRELERTLKQGEAARASAADDAETSR